MGASELAAGTVVRLGEGMGVHYDGHIVARMTGDILNPWVGLTWDQDEADPFLTDEDIDDAGYEVVWSEGSDNGG